MIVHYLQIFHPHSRKGILFALFLLHVITFLFCQLSAHSFLITILYLFSLFLLIVILYNLPDSFSLLLFPPVDNDLLNLIPKSVLISNLKFFRLFFNFSENLRQSIILRIDLLTISGLLSLIFGFILLLNFIPPFVIFHLLIVTITIMFSITVTILIKTIPVS